MISISIITKGHESIKFMESLFLFPAYCLMILNIYTKFCENIWNGFIKKQI